MRATGWGAALWGLGATLCATGILIGSIMPVLVGTTLLVYLESTRTHLRSTHLRMHRDLPPSMRANTPFTVTTTVTSDPNVPVRIHDAGLVGADVLRHRQEEHPGRSVATDRVQVDGVGVRQWDHAQVTIMDPWQVHEQLRTVRQPTTLQVAPEHTHRYTGRRIGARHAIQTQARDRHGHDPSMELESIRPYGPGDRVRDIDWAHSTRMDTLLVHQKERMAPRPILTFVDATRTMRWQRRTMRYDTAARFATALVAGARAGGVRPDLIVCSEDGVMRGAATLTDPVASSRLQAATSPIPVQRIPRPDRAATTGGHGLALESGLRVLAQSVSGPSFVTAVLDAEWTPDATLAAVRRILDLGHHVAVVVPAMGAHQFTKQDADRHTLDLLAMGQRNRQRVRSVLARWGVPLFVLAPDNIPDVVQEVLRCAK